MKKVEFFGFLKPGKGEYIGKGILNAFDLFLHRIGLKTSNFENDGEDGKNPFISAKALIQDGTDKILKKGNYVWNEDYNFTALSNTWLKNGVTYTNPITQTIHEPSHATKNRTDTIVLGWDANGNGVIRILLGDEIVGIGVAPIPNPDTELFLTTVDIDAATTEPSQVTDIILYDEDETVVDANGASVVGDAGGAYSGAKCILATDFTTGESFYVKKAGDVDFTTQNDFLFQIKPESGKWDNNGTIRFALINNANEIISNTVTIHSKIDNSAGSSFAFDSKKNIWQFIAVPMVVLNPTSSVGRGIVVLKDDGRGTDSFKMDLIRTQVGISTPSTAFPEYTLNPVSTYVFSLLKDGVIVTTITIGTPPPPIEDTYADIAALLADQGNQTEDYLYEVTDASTDPAVTTGRAVYHYLGVANGLIGDYHLEWKEETASFQTAAETPFTPYLTLSSVEVQAIIQELKDELDLIAIGASKPPIEDTYVNIAALLADQGNQDDDYIYEVTDASTDPNVTAGIAAYHYLGVANGVLATDYHLAWKAETARFQTAAETSFTPYLTLSSVELQAVVQELKDELDLVSAGASPGVQNRYANIAALLADQGNQLDKGIQLVVDASTDATVNSGYAYYEKLTATTGAISDYRKLTEEESLDITGSVLTHNQTVPADVWTFVHGLNTTNLLVTVYGADGKVTIPQDVEPTDANTLVVTFPTGTNETGTITVGGAGLIAPIVDNLQKEVTDIYIVANGDNKYTIWLNKATPFTVTITHPLSNNLECYFINKGVGLVSFVQGGGTTLISPNGLDLAQNKTGFLIKNQGNNEYWLTGGFA